ncbi:MAG: repeat-containing protein [Acidobacteria bacterium]|nr:repeat-containing protein [Acidobacteriota bacterium]
MADAPPPAPEVPFRSSSTASFPALLHQLGISLLVTTYQSGRLIAVRAESATSLNTHFRLFRSPMGLAVTPDRLALGVDRGVWDYRNQPAVAERLEPRGKHDACFIPRNLHVTGDIRIHEIGFAGGELWIVNTRFSTLCTVEADHSFVPRWRPRFVTHLAAEDRCHLNGMAIIDDRVRYVTALGTTNVAGGWREKKADGGVLIDVDSHELVLQALSMPHSPRRYGERFFILESGKGTFASADLASGRVETIAELPGFTRGLAFAGPYAFIGLSQVRESNVFGGIPLVERVADRRCGVWVVDLRTGQTAGFLRFEGNVQEIFDIQVAPFRFPEIVEDTDDVVAGAFTLPDEALREVAT